MRLLRLLLLPALIAALSALPAGAATTYVNTKIFTLGGGKTRTYKVAVPHALQWGNAKYTYRYGALPPATVKQGQGEPNLAKVKFLRSGYTQGGTVVFVKVRNGNRASTAPVRIRIRAITRH